MIVNLCSRCGKQRVISKKWTEVLVTMRGEINIQHTESMCPNKECQKIVNKELQVEEQKRLKLKEKKEENDKLRNSTNLRNKKIAAAAKN